MATKNLQPHKVFPAGLGVNEKGGQARVYAVTTDAVQILWKGDSLQYVPSRGQTSSGSGTVVEMPGVLLYRVERFTTGLYGTFAERSRCFVDIEDSQHRTICPTLDSVSGSVDGIDEIRTSSQGLPRRVTIRRLSIRLHDAALGPS